MRQVVRSEDNQDRARQPRQQQGAQSRPWATSVDCEGPQMRASSIQNMIEQHDWETRLGISDSFDPQRRGYTYSGDDSRQQRNQGGRVEKRTIVNGRDGNGYCGGRSDNQLGRPRHFQRDQGGRRSPARDFPNRTYRSGGASNGRSGAFYWPSSTEHVSGARFHRNHSGHEYQCSGHGKQHSRNGIGSGDQRPNGQTRRHRTNDNSHQGRGPLRWEQRLDERNHGGNGSPQTTMAVVPQIGPTSTSQQFMLILTGIPGSGKSTFAVSLVRGKPYIYLRVNQDALGSRPACEQLAREALSGGRCPIIDRCNFDPSQRSKFINIAKSFHVPVDCVVFQFPMDLCIRRCQDRRNHETVNAENAAQVVTTMVRQFSPPLPNRNNSETFRSIKVVDSASAVQDLALEYLNIMP